MRNKEATFTNACNRRLLRLLLRRKMFEASKKSNVFVILTNLKSGVYAEIPVDSLVRGIRLGLFSLKQK